jgi:hypothetical protein
MKTPTGQDVVVVGSRDEKFIYDAVLFGEEMVQRFGHVSLTCAEVKALGSMSGECATRRLSDRIAPISHPRFDLTDSSRLILNQNPLGKLRTDQRSQRSVQWREHRRIAEAVVEPHLKTQEVAELI